MKKESKRINLQNGKTRHIVIIKDDPVDPSQIDLDSRQFLFLQILAQSPDVLTCGPVRWEKLRLYFSGQEWVAEAEAVTDT